MTLLAAITRFKSFGACSNAAGGIRRQRCWRMFSSNIGASKVERRYGKVHACIIAGEPSGDVIGGNLIESLRNLSGGNIIVSGVGGKRMEHAGLSKSCILR